MNWRLWAVAIWAASLAPVALAQQPGELISSPPPPEPVDHVAVIVVTPAGGPPRTELVTVTRSGAWQREDVRREGAPSTLYTDFERDVSVTWGRGKDGGEFLQAKQNKPSGAPAFVRERTGEMQTWVGETCEVWSSRLAQPTSRYDSGKLSCLTLDGIELWRGHWGYDGTVRETFHAMLVERRDVRPEEVRLPPAALEWNRWRAGAAGGDPAIGHEVTLSGGAGSDIIIRRRGDWTLNDARLPRSRSFHIFHPQVGLNFTDIGNRLSLSLGRYVSPPQLIGGEPERTGREETILDRHCIWYDTMPDIYDAGATECRDANGVVLGLIQTARANVTLDVRATRFSASPAPERALAPPPEVFSWITGQSSGAAERSNPPPTARR